MPSLKPLPDCEGPKLEAFTDDLFAHDVEFLSINFAGDDGLHSQIFKTMIDGKLYCLKMFTVNHSFLSPDSHIISEKTYEYVKRQPEDVQALVRMQTTGFQNECRAYGRLRETGLEHLAGKVYGYVQFRADDERYERLYWACEDKNKSTYNCTNPYERRSIPRAWIGRPDKDDKPDPRPAVGIVKEWLGRSDVGNSDDGDYAVTKTRLDQLPQMLRDLHELHRIGIVNRDLNSNHYVDGLLCDFSSAWTIPHALGPDGGVLPSSAFASMAAFDLWRFQTIVIEDHNYWAAQDPRETRKAPCRLRAYPAYPRRWTETRPPKPIPNRGDRLKTLRHMAHRHGPFLPMLDGDEDTWTENFIAWPKHDPAAFDWKGTHVAAEEMAEGGRGTPAGESRKRQKQAGGSQRKRAR
ncbi:kinetochore Sim4 complex subunit FTA2-domain-containing protein [Plectosphaerella plurivora]|uniref:Kinetochore Sim4 complex subunit FTA2-domain-containing protein n=1 Tax=Plectosphaerella plurivora TaxID=936078 RepID=A0A9P8V9L7_9PEZI|nr:kinetochore Sim4 complex subunit FTA2-domain-containing protein [Plectosphaerella plurivora]